jgi:hypothetical protein
MLPLRSIPRVRDPDRAMATFDAMFVVSNDVVRDSVARACEALGVPWYGPTFDS